MDSTHRLQLTWLGKAAKRLHGLIPRDTGQESDKAPQVIRMCSLASEPRIDFQNIHLTGTRTTLPYHIWFPVPDSREEVLNKYRLNGKTCKTPRAIKRTCKQFLAVAPNEQQVVVLYQQRLSNELGSKGTDCAPKLPHCPLFHVQQGPRDGLLSSQPSAGMAHTLRGNGQPSWHWGTMALHRLLCKHSQGASLDPEPWGPLKPGSLGL